jgi:hypothetical protein
MNKLIIFSLMITPLISIAQPGIEWQRCYGGSNTDAPSSLQICEDGGFVAIGQTLSQDGNVTGLHGASDAWLIRIDSSGQLLWQKTYGGSGIDRALEVRTTSDGGFILCGHTLSNDGDVSGNNGYYDAWVLKLNEIGDIEWQKCFGGTDWDEALDIVQTQDGGYVIAGHTLSDDGDVSHHIGGHDYWVVKINSVGEIEWEKTYGGTGHDKARSIIQTPDGGYIVAGESASNDGDVSVNKGQSDYWVVKLNFEGKIEWEKSYGGSTIDEGYTILNARDGGYLVYGQTYSSDGDIVGHHGFYDWWVIKLNQSGNIIWTKTLGGNQQEYAYRANNSNEGGFILTGATLSTNGDITNSNGGSEAWIVKLSNDGDLLWQRTLGGGQQEQGKSILQIQDGSYILIALAWSNDGDVSGVQGKSDYWIVKLSPETSSIPETPAGPLLLAPNPAQDYVRIRVPQQEGLLHITLSDATGRILQRRTIPNDSEFDLSGLPVGMYLFSATDKDGRVYAGKVARE